MNTKIFINLPVKNLEAAKAFYIALGCTLNEQFSNEQGASVMMSEHIYIMLLTQPFFKSFLEKEKDIADATKATEVINAFSCESREEVDEITNKAQAAGGRLVGAPEDHGYMYSQAFEDLDGHYWNPFYMDMTAVANGAMEGAQA